ncbi:MAG: exopolysaccharide biosynthesis polyprenyl glycosylphosphotransferase [Kiritimatiellae bacterium]|nr:exopolysaccharide biosynthesis polyprenyl glycosylphosphotransferase [Kiritimatiellia bacterium]MDD5523072.1 exopolysaccharide biosynthesis polyprenyl glycosylphosphotransferase [Kiritimatiellia bacterium]
MFTNRKIRNLWLVQFFADFAAIVAAYYTTLLIRFHSDIGEEFFTFVNKAIRARETGALSDMFEDFYVVSAPRIIFFMVITLSILYALRDLYPGRKFIRPRPIAWNVIVANLMAILVFFTYFYLRRNIFHPRSFFMTVIFFNIIYCIYFRSLMDKLLKYLRSNHSIDQVRAVLLGKNEKADLINDLICRIHPHGIIIVDRIPNSASDAGFERTIAKLEESANKYEAEMVIAADNDFTVPQIMRLLELADKLGMSAKVLSDKLSVLINQAKLPVDVIHGTPFVHFEVSRVMRDETGISKNLLSVAVGYFMVVILLPLIALITLLIRTTSKGAAIFVQERIGVNRKPFKMYKFRTMHDRAEELQAQVEEFNESGDGLFKIKNDPRVTPVGRFLRRFSLDELPQLINVMRGEMKIVGPRPLPWRDFKNYYEEWHYSRHGGLPGLTCLWQVSGRSDVDFHNMCILDVYYLRNRNWVMDLKIMLKTIWVVLFAKGAY